MATEEGLRRTAAARAKRTRTKHERWIQELKERGHSVTRVGGNGLSEETIVALKNFAWLAEHRNAYIDWSVDAVLYGDGGCEARCLTKVGMTPATRA